MLSIIICDDEETSGSALQKFIGDYALLHRRKDLSVSFYSDPLSADFRWDGDIYFLDIIMPGRSGLELCKDIRGKNPEAKIVFCTSSREFALEAYELRALHYLVKPVSSEKLYVLMDELLSQDKPRRKVAIDTKEGMIVVDMDEIVSLEYSNHRIRYVMSDGRTLYTVTSRAPFSVQVEQFVRGGDFLHPHQAFLVNKAYVVNFQPERLKLVNGEIVPIAKLKRAAVKDAYMEYLSELGKKERTR